ncbi:hypothetical protein [Bosea sp. (in: a-proteobacteria)]|jgi:hypothetical protein|uniref:hypothetical protein n=1 Tax=Bosea sp. (in: a-proteobacteria) TaxID=1871050 RepID=UPI002DDCEA7F|nr:hypothetical protein [Bosea sp. (in: a-proteobacteria)]HEV2513569.1 hypothetical protein [Bosea sp. (in: a-proteobacteria)]
MAEKSGANEKRLTAYNSVRAEINQRFTLRDQALFVFMAASGAYTALSVEKHQKLISSCTTSVSHFESILLLLPIPLISLAFTNIALGHHLVIDKLWNYILIELKDKSGTKFWEESDLAKQKVYFLDGRTLSQMIILSTPCLYQIVISIYIINFCKIDSTEILYYASAIILDAMVLYYNVKKHWDVHKERKIRYEKLNTN